MAFDVRVGVPKLPAPDKQLEGGPMQVRSLSRQRAHDPTGSAK